MAEAGSGRTPVEVVTETGRSHWYLMQNVPAVGDEFVLEDEGSLADVVSRRWEIRSVKPITNGHEFVLTLTVRRRR